ncbi:beta-ketoacyl synthase [Teredinibacter sp. KSP-S5-2]|uniref:beta-ketoacyl synthase n=1 Tax=Teredinibacter sp. KSP-S5-2 TaxID=3034506 RepID=UPI002934A1A5|nr:beta-ketoacyl synthase [Teredinibacter sp. KSP-S5-2]WNO10903.1 beta-ketoacyl synthase [Teredinibacter sp. KSP-S5-2]
MTSFLPLIVGFGGYNAAGRSSFHRAYERMILESLGEADRAKTLSSLAHIMGKPGADEQEILLGSLVRRIEPTYFDVEKAPFGKTFPIRSSGSDPVRFVLSARELPEAIPEHWHVEPVAGDDRQFQVTLMGNQSVRVNSHSPIAVQSAGQLPSGFNPADHYRSMHHPRGLQLTVLGASDAVRSMGIKWSNVAKKISPDQVAVYASSVMSQLDQSGFGGMMQARQNGARVTSKQLPLGMNTMPADFVNAYILGSLGSTGGVTGACATFLFNLRQAVEEIRMGRKKVAVVGCSEAPILPEVIDGYAAMSALATDDNLRKLDQVDVPDYRRASRPFSENCGFTLAESSQYIVLMADDLAIEMGAQIYGAVPGVYVNADGFKKSISAPGAGNYITMARAVGLANTLLGEEAVKNGSFVQAHGSSTPQNRVTESKIFDKVAEAFGIQNWPVAAVKSYVGHSLGPASGDQIAASLGVFARGILPGIKTIDSVADDVFSARLDIRKTDNELGEKGAQVAFLNSKGFGGNNATATVFSPSVVDSYLANHYSSSQLLEYKNKREQVESMASQYCQDADLGKLSPIYEFGNNLLDEDSIQVSKENVCMPGYKATISLQNDEGLSGFKK